MPDMDEAMATYIVEAVKNRRRDAFVARRMPEAARRNVVKKGREIRNIPNEMKGAFRNSDYD